MNQSSRICSALVFLGASMGTAGCYATLDPPIAYAEVSEAPVAVDITTYPHTSYEGRDVYLYKDRWYYRDGARWAYYRREPTVLRQRRYVQKAPPARRY